MTSAARPSLMSRETHAMLGMLHVNGAAIEASKFDRETPTDARFNAATSLAEFEILPEKLFSSKIGCIEIFDAKAGNFETKFLNLTSIATERADIIHLLEQFDNLCFLLRRES